MNILRPDRPAVRITGLRHGLERLRERVRRGRFRRSAIVAGAFVKLSLDVLDILQFLV